MEISEKVKNFIKEHANDDLNALRLKFSGKSKNPDFPIDFALLQIESRRKCQKKIPSFLKNELFLFPDSLAAEQASNEAVARYHASLLESGSTLLDLTAGLGIDDFTFAMSGIKVTACEIDETKAEALLHNSKILEADGSIDILNVDSTEFIQSCPKHFDVVFADPARRSTSGQRLHALSDCRPDILGHMKTLMCVSDRMLIKSSPLLDVTLIRASVEHLHHIHIICFKGECKEVLIDIRRNSEYTGTTVVDLDMDETISIFECHHSPIPNNVIIADRLNPTDYKYIYEPNAGVMKTGAWGEMTDRFKGLHKADRNTHIFLSDTFFPDYPGRILIIEGQPDRKTLKKMKGSKCNVVARNYPISAPELSKKHSLIPGGDKFLYAFGYNGKPVSISAIQVKKEMQGQE